MAIKTVSVGGTVTILENRTSIKDAMQIALKTKYLSRKKSITYFKFSGIIVDRDGLNIRSRSVSINVLGPGHQL